VLFDICDLTNTTGMTLLKIVHSLWGLRPAVHNRHTRAGYSLSTFHLKTQVDPASETLWGFCWGSWQCPKFHLWLIFSLL